MGGDRPRRARPQRRVFRDVVAPAAVWAVVKADGYGHGAIDVAAQALAAGAAGLCVALAQEGVELRAGGDRGADPRAERAAARPARARSSHTGSPRPCTRRPYIEALGRARVRRARRCDVHLKVDTGMQRVGAASSATRSSSPTSSCGTDRGSGWPACSPIWRAPTMSPTPATAAQLAAFDARARRARRRGCARVDHAANSAGALGPSGESLSTWCAPGSRSTASRRARRRPPRPRSAPGDEPAGEGVARQAGRRPARTSRTDGATASTRATTVATVPIGYADGVPRRLGTLSDRPAATC